MKLITEQIYDLRCFTESIEGSDIKHLFLEGPALIGDKPNKNNRVYPWPILEEKADKYITDYVNKNRAFGELGHPEGPRINLDRVSHLITELRKDGTTYTAKSRVGNEGMGKIAHGLIEMGGTLGYSSRAIGSLKQRKDGLNEVQKDLHIATACDLVADPSAPGAFVNGIYEQAEWIYDNGILKMQDAEKLKEQVDRAYAGNQRDRESLLIESFKSFLDKLSKVKDI